MASYRKKFHLKKKPVRPTRQSKICYYELHEGNSAQYILEQLLKLKEKGVDLEKTKLGINSYGDDYYDFGEIRFEYLYPESDEELQARTKWYEKELKKYLIWEKANKQDIVKELKLRKQEKELKKRKELEATKKRIEKIKTRSEKELRALKAKLNSLEEV